MYTACLVIVTVLNQMLGYAQFLFN